MPVSVGADAHEPKDCGRDFDLARALLLEAGYRETVIFADRKISDTLPLR